MDEYSQSEDALRAKLIDFEQQLAFQQRAHEELNAVVLEQQASLEQARQEIEKLKQLVRQLNEQGLGEDLPHERPPHY